MTFTGDKPWPNFLPALPFATFAGIFGFAGTLEIIQSIDKFSL